jgi:tetrahydromethanopterin S-methyltransferase subunit G
VPPDSDKFAEIIKRLDSIDAKLAKIETIRVCPLATILKTLSKE